MENLRAPDPTLDALAPGYVVEFVTSDLYGEPAEAHRINSLHAFGPMIPANDARWFAVPCRECFPDAPPPGKYPFSAERTLLDDAGLAWQVEQ